MIKIKIEKRIDKNGQVSLFCNDVCFYNEETGYKFSDKSVKLTRELTGTTRESGQGVFNEETDFFEYGSYETNINHRKIDINYSVLDIADIIEERIKLVRSWVFERKNDVGIVERVI